MAISIVLMNYESYKITHIYNKEGNNRDPRTTKLVRISKEEAGIQGPPIRSEFKKKDAGIHGRSTRSEFLKGNERTHGRPNRSKF